MNLLITAVAGSIGALCRYLVTGYVQRRTKSPLPFGTAAVNLVGAFAVGLVAGASQFNSPGPLAIAGFLGGFTTFSTWTMETIRLGVITKPRVQAYTNAVVTLVAGVALAGAGFMLTN